jgi:hypothetical protein
MTSPESQLEEELIAKLVGLKYEHRTDIRDRASLEKNFREKFEALNRVRLTDAEFPRLLDEIVTPDVFTAAHTLRNRNSFTRDDGTPLTTRWSTSATGVKTLSRSLANSVSTPITATTGTTSFCLSTACRPAERLY